MDTTLDVTAQMGAKLWISPPQATAEAGPAVQDAAPLFPVEQVSEGLRNCSSAHGCSGSTDLRPTTPGYHGSLAGAAAGDGGANPPSGGHFQQSQYPAEAHHAAAHGSVDGSSSSPPSSSPSSPHHPHQHHHQQQQQQQQQHSLPTELRYGDYGYVRIFRIELQPICRPVALTVFYVFFSILRKASLSFF